MSNSYHQFRVFTNNWKDILIKQTCIIKEKMHMFFKKISNNSQSFSELVVKQEELKNDYYNKKTKLIEKKESLWRSLNFSQWDLNPMEEMDKTRIYQDKAYSMKKMCFKETIELNDVGNLLGYYYSKNGETFWNMIHSFEKLSVQNMAEFSSLFEPTLSDSINVWSNFSTNIG